VVDGVSDGRVGVLADPDAFPERGVVAFATIGGLTGAGAGGAAALPVTGSVAAVLGVGSGPAGSGVAFSTAAGGGVSGAM
jgi:hypothetical protein